jgi:hypothetical protein
MFDEIDHLRDSELLRRLMNHYASLGSQDREIWQDRLMQMEGVDPRQLVNLHGELIAFQWIEQNTGCTPAARPAVVAGCYRITSQGLRALRRAQVAREHDEEAAEAA